MAGIDAEALAEFRAGIRRRYSDEQILEALRASAERLGRSPTMKEFAADPEAAMHPQTVIEHFGTWNAAKRAAGLMPRRFATREELVEQLRRLGAELGRTPTALDIRGGAARCRRRRSTGTRSGRSPRRSARRASTWRWGRSASNGRSSRARRSRSSSGRLPKFGDWQAARRADESLLTEWQVYRLFDARRGAWATFQYLVRERLVEEGASVASDGTVF